MELKVWVEGIQRVVCGANLTTTCQDVVVALAHAMGRTGRFTLVERWREAERPLTPAECPLVSLHKWGEYAGEVRFYLVQAEADKVKAGGREEQQGQQQRCGGQRLQWGGGGGVGGGRTDGFSHNFTPPSSRQMPPAPETVKRSSTFSGAHHGHYATLPPPSSSSSSSAMPSSSTAFASQKHGHRQHQLQQQLWPQDQRHQQYQQPHPHPHRHQQQQRHPPPSHQYRQQQLPTVHRGHPSSSSAKSSHIVLDPIRNGDIPGRSSASSSNSSPRSSSSKTSPRELPPSYSSRGHNSKDPYPGDTRELHPANLPGVQVSYPGETNTYHDNRHFHSAASSHPSASPSSAPHPASQPFYQPEARISTQRPSSQSPSNPPVPSPRHSHQPQSSESPPYENLQAQQRQQTRPAFLIHQEHGPEPVSRTSVEVTVETHLQERAKQFPEKGSSEDVRSVWEESGHSVADGKHRNNAAKLLGKRHQGFCKENMEFEKGRSHSQDGAGFKRTASGKSKGGGDTGSYAASGEGLGLKGGTALRTVPVPQHSHGVPISSSSANSAGKTSSSSQLSQSLPASKLNLLHQRGETSGGERVSFVDSALMKQQRSSFDTATTSALSPSSSSAAAVHRARQQGMDSSHPHSRSFECSQEEPMQGSDVKGVPKNAIRLPVVNSSDLHLHYADLSAQSANPALRPFSGIRHNSAFTEVSPRNSRTNSSSSPSAAPVAYNLDTQNFDQLGSIGQPSSELSHSRQDSLEIEEYDLDQTFPDVHHRGGGGELGVSRPSMPQEYRMEDSGMELSLSSIPAEPENVRLLRTVRMQQEKLKVQEAQINDVNSELENLEERELKLKAELELVSSEATELELQEGEVGLELEDLEQVQWVSVMEEEVKLQAELTVQMSTLKDKVAKVETELVRLKEVEELKSQELQEEWIKVKKEEAQSKQREEMAQDELKLLHSELEEVGGSIQESEQRLSDVESLVQETEDTLRKQEDTAMMLEAELKDQNMKDFQAYPVAKESAPVSHSTAPIKTPATTLSPTVMSAADAAASQACPERGEAILKLLEGHMSPRRSPTLASEQGGSSSASSNNNGGKGSSILGAAQQILAARNSNGVWV